MDVECKDETYMSCIDGMCGCGINQIIGRNGDICYGMAGKVLTKSKACFHGSIINSSGICSCDNPKLYYAGIDGHCHLRKSHGELCSEDIECEYDKAYLTCVNGKCGCNPETAQYREFVESIEVEKTREELNPNRYQIYNYEPDYIAVRYTVTESKELQQCVGLVWYEITRCSMNITL